MKNYPLLKICFTSGCNIQKFIIAIGTTASKVSKHRISSGPYIPVLGLNTGKYGPEKTPYLDTFHAVNTIAVEW